MRFITDFICVFLRIFIMVTLHVVLSVAAIFVYHLLSRRLLAAVEEGKNCVDGFNLKKEFFKNLKFKK